MVRLVISIVLLALWLPPVMGRAVGTSRAVESRYQGSGVRVTGATVTAREFHDRSAPWQKDILKQPLPNYPYQARAHWWQGHGLFRIVIDVNTGLAREVTAVH